MNPLVESFTSPEWTLVVKALLHTLWLGGAAALLLAIALRFSANPVLRYRFSLTALATVLLGGLIAWAALERSPATPVSADHTVPIADFKPTTREVGIGEPSEVKVVATALKPAPPAPSSWTAWLALIWIAGAAVMLLRASAQVAGAERLRRSCRPLENNSITNLMLDARKALRLTRQVRIAVTEKLTSPAVVGVLVPTLILPLSLVTALSYEQIRFILLHELAHIRRGDYLANLFQLFAEALLFFNPAVWWISHQIRREREACCDALAIELSGAPADYARTLVHVAERALNPIAAAPAFGNRHETSSLADRIQRLLVPGYRPALRLTWRAMLASLFLGSVLLVLSAVGTRMTIAAILTPQQRMDRIETKLAEYDQISEIPTYNESEAAEQVSVSGRVRTEDGSPLPHITWINAISVVRHGSIGSSLAIKTDGTFEGALNPGNLILSAEAPGFAPVQFGPVTVTGTNSLKDAELVLRRGFAATLQLISASTGGPIPDAQIHARFWTRGANQTSFTEHLLKTGSDGLAVLTNAADLPLAVAVNVPGYELREHQFPSVTPDTPLRLALHPAKLVSGNVHNKLTGTPIAGATVRVLHERGASSRHYGWTDTKWVVAESGADGKFAIRQLRGATKYWLGISAPGHESAIIELSPGDTPLEVRLGPELVVKGTVTGSFEGLQQINKDLVLGCSQGQIFDNASHPEHIWVPLRITNGVGHFQFTNRTPGTVTLSARSGGTFSRLIDAPVSDWNIQLEKPAAATTNVPSRDVVFRFLNRNGPLPRGTVAIRTADVTDPKRWAYYNEEKEIENGEARISIPIGVETSLEPRRMIGFWFDPAGPNGSLRSIPVTNGLGPLVIQVPVVPAGAIYARAFSADGTPLGGLFFGVHEIKRSPHRAENSHLGSTSDSFPDDSPRKWASPALPLGGTYQVYGWRGNSFCVSKPITLTEAVPDAEIQLRFPEGRALEGFMLEPGGKPLAHAELKGWFTLSNGNGYGLKPVFTDENGRFQIGDATPGVGEYTIEATAPGIMAERVKLQLKPSPQVIQLKPGYHLGGQVVESDTGYPIPGVELRAFPGNDGASTVTTRTDAQGRFHFSTLKDAEYNIFVDDAQRLDSRKLRADGRTNHVLRVKLYEWSKVKPKAPAPAPSGGSASNHRAAAEFATPELGDDPGAVYNSGQPTSEARFRVRSTSQNSPPSLATAASSFSTVESSTQVLRDSKGQPVEITCDSMILDVAAGIMTASNNVVLKHTNVLIRADKATINQESGEIRASGGLLYQRDQVAWEGGSIRYNFNTGEMTLTGSVNTTRKRIIAKLDQLRLENVYFDRQPLSNVVRSLSQDVRRFDPAQRGVNFLINPGSPSTDSNTPPFDMNSVIVSINPTLMNVRLVDVLDAIVTVADKPIKYSVNDYAVIFSPKGPEGPTLHVRTFKVNSTAFLAHLCKLNPALTDLMAANSNRTGSVPIPRVSVAPSTAPPADQAARDMASAVQSTFLQFIAELGVDLSPQKGKNVFYSDGSGAMMIRATQEELDKIEKALSALNSPSSPTGQATPGRSQAETLVQNGKFFYEAGRLDQAQAELEKALAIDPGNAAAQFYLEQVKSQKQRGGAAAPAIRRIINPVIRWTNSESPNLPDEIKRDIRPLPSSVTNAEARAFRMNPDRVIQNLESLKAIDMPELRKAQTAADSSLVEQIVGGAIFEWFFKNGVERNPAKTLVFLRWNNTSGILKFRATSEERRKIESLAVRLDPQMKPAVINLHGEFQELTTTNLDSRIFTVDWTALKQNLLALGELDLSSVRGLSSSQRENRTKQLVIDALVESMAVTGLDGTVQLNATEGTLLIRASPQTLANIENFLEVLNIPLAQVNIEALAIGVNEPGETFLKSIGVTSLTNLSGTVPLKPDEFRKVQVALQNRPHGVLIRGQVTTSSGRQSQIQQVDLKTVVTNLNPRALKPPGIQTLDGSLDLFETTSLSTGFTLDVIPYHSTNNPSIIQLTLVPAVTEFLGYENHGVVTYQNGKMERTPWHEPKTRRHQQTANPIVWDGQTAVLFGDDLIVTTSAPGKPGPKRYVLVFVTPTLIDARGERLHPEKP